MTPRAPARLWRRAGQESVLSRRRVRCLLSVYLGTQAYVLFRIGPALIEIRRNPHKNVQQRPFFVARCVPPSDPMTPVRVFSQLVKQPFALLGPDELPCPSVLFASSPFPHH